MKSKTRFAVRLAASLAIACGAFQAAQAHNLWLLPSTTVLSKAEWITVDAAVSNDLFFFNHVPLGLDNLVVSAPDGSAVAPQNAHRDRKSTRLNSSHSQISYAVFCLKKKNSNKTHT